MGGPSERELMEKLGKIREKILKTEKDINNEFSKMEKIKLDALKRTEEVKRSADHNLEKIEKDIVKSADLAPESKQRLSQEISLLKNEIFQRYTDLKTRITRALTPR